MDSNDESSKTDVEANEDAERVSYINYKMQI